MICFDVNGQVVVRAGGQVDGDSSREPESSSGCEAVDSVHDADGRDAKLARVGI
jgi:hypothetical protein